MISWIGGANEVLGADAQLARGARLFKKCIHCHTYRKNDMHRIGPNLFGLFGRRAGTVPDFDFSPAWQNSEIIWTEETLDEYLKSPRQMIPNNLMPFDGLSRPEDRHALILYLKTIVQDR